LNAVFKHLGLGFQLGDFGSFAVDWAVPLGCDRTELVHTGSPKHVKMRPRVLSTGTSRSVSRCLRLSIARNGRPPVEPHRDSHRSGDLRGSCCTSAVRAISVGGVGRPTDAQRAFERSVAKVCRRENSTSSTGNRSHCGTTPLEPVVDGAAAAIMERLGDRHSRESHTPKRSQLNQLAGGLAPNNRCGRRWLFGEPPLLRIGAVITLLP